MVRVIAPGVVDRHVHANVRFGLRIRWETSARAHFGILFLTESERALGASRGVSQM